MSVDAGDDNRSAACPTLQELLREWSDFDGAKHAIAVCLGLMPDDWQWVLKNAKWVLWSNNPVGNMLGNILKGLVEQGVLEENEDWQFRYNVNFKPPWER
jgi:hypothetical protein